MSLYLCIDAEANTPFLRYFHFPETCEEPNEAQVEAEIGPVEGSQKKKVTFFLYKPEENGSVTHGEVTLEEMMEELADAWEDYQGERVTSYLLVGIRSKNLVREVKQFNRMLDWHEIPKGLVNLEGLEVSEDVREIRFNWEDFGTAVVEWNLRMAVKADLSSSPEP